MKQKNFEDWLMRNLRMVSYKYLPRSQALKEARVTHGRYKCAHCGGVFGKKDTQLDHVVPVVDPTTGLPRLPDGQFDWNVYVRRLFVAKSGWQVVCKQCHQLKTNEENKIRKANRTKSDYTKWEV